MRIPICPQPARLSAVIGRIAAIKARFRSAATGFADALAVAEREQVPTSQVGDAVASSAARYGIAPAVLSALAQVESGFRATAVSPAGAAGVMQLMPATARRLGVTDPFDVEANVDAGARYLREQLDRFGGNLALALAAYNAGPSAVLRYGGIPPYPETEYLISRVLNLVSQTGLQ